MPIETRYVLVASMDVDPEYEELFNALYDEHAEYLASVPGVRSITRMKGEPFSLIIASEVKEQPAPSPVYTAIYEINSPAVLNSTEWAKAVEEGRWATEIRPHTRNRHHAVYEVRRTVHGI